MKNKNRYWIIGLIIIIGIITTSFKSIVYFITDLKWFSEVNFISAFLTKIKSELLIGIPLFLVLMFLLYYYIKKVFNSVNRDIVDISKIRRKKNIFMFLASVIVSLFLTKSMTSTLWLKILEAINSKNFNITDPIFNNDISFYVFKLPLINIIIGILINVLVIMLIINVATNFIGRLGKTFNNIREEESYNKNFNMSIDKKVIVNIIKQISVLGSILLILFGIKIYLSSFDILYSQRGRVFGAAYTDVVVNLNIYRIMAILCIISSITFFYGARKKSIKIALSLPVLVIVISLVGSLTAGAVEKFVVEPDQLSKESKYFLNNIKYTQYAYGLDKVKELDFEANNNISKKDIENNIEVIENIRINDNSPLRQVYNKLQGIRPYYVFNNVDIDRYYINGQYKQAYLSARELDQNLLNEQAKTWVNQYLKYTHGYGIALSPVNKVTSQGQPEMLIKNIPPVTDTNLKVNRPEIYFGEKTNDYVIVNTEEKEFDYPSGSDNVECEYEGTAGINMSFMNKLLFSIREGNYKLLISNNIDNNSKIIINRNIIERVKTIAPFLSYEEDPYIVLNQENGKLYWIIDAFTMSSKFPYSMPFGDYDINYISNSVKVVVDAYNGKTDFYIVDKTDPVIMTYNDIFKGLFKNVEDMPKGLKSHIRYSRQMFNIQAEMYRAYHMENSTVFFGKEDYWDFSKQKYQLEEKIVEPNYYMFKLPNEDNIEFLLTIPFTPQNKDNMSAMLIARNDGENYGELLLYRFPKNKTVKGTALIESKIDQNTTISSQLTLWSREGSRVLRGNTLIIPIEDSLLYVEPIYLQSDTQSNFPEMKMVVVAYDDKIVMESTLDKALNKLLGDIYSDNFDKEDEEGSEIEDDKNNTNNNYLINKANKLLLEANNALKDTNWTLYGEKMKELEQILKQLESNVVNVEETDSNINNQNDNN